MSNLEPINDRRHYRKLHQAVVDAGQDREWYPTTEEIIDAVFEHAVGEGEECYPSILDVGAGDGKVLLGLDRRYRENSDSNTGCQLYAMEQSTVLINHLLHNTGGDVALVGTEFTRQTLIDKKVDVVFCNPPYSEFTGWADKAIREANAHRLYLVLPVRWSDSDVIAGALEARNATAEVLGEFSFEAAEDRKARARVNLIHVKLRESDHRRWIRYREGRHGEKQARDPFDVWFDSFFGDVGDDSDRTSYEREQGQKQTLRDKTRAALVEGGDLASTLEALYQQEMAHLIENYQTITSLDGDLLQELEVSKKSLKEALKQRINSLKDRYWDELFDGFEPIIDRLTTSSRRKMLDRLQGHTHVDFSAENAYAVALFAVQEASKYYDEQLIETVEKMVSHANIKLYRSNERTYGENDWRYTWQQPNYERYSLDLRVVLERVGGINTDWMTIHARNGLEERAFDFINDLVTVAKNLGFTSAHRAGSFEWESGKKCLFRQANGEMKPLMEIKSFKNGNTHIRFSPSFILALNVEHGRLKGWLNSAEQAAEEMGENVEDVAKHWGTNLSLTADDIPRLMNKSA